jgi:hypothetical protein
MRPIMGWPRPWQPRLSGLSETLTPPTSSRVSTASPSDLFPPLPLCGLCPKNVILRSPSLRVILSEAKNLNSLRVNSATKNLKLCMQNFLRNNLAACNFRPFILPAGEFRVTM